jgi:hypothetical protein
LHEMRAIPFVKAFVDALGDQKGKAQVHAGTRGARLTKVLGQ